MLQKPLNFIHISDTHIHKDPNYKGNFVNFSARAGVAALVQHINELPAEVDFVLHTGDIMHDPQKPEDYLIAGELLADLRCPVYYMAGNHDNVLGIQQYLMERGDHEISTRLDYILEVRGVQILCLDSTTPAPNQPGGIITDAQLAWLDDLCSVPDGPPIVVALHHHTLALHAPWLDNIMLRNGLALHNTLLKARHRLRGVFYGHIHENTVTMRDGISYYSALSGWFQTRTWHQQQNPANDPAQQPGFTLVTLTARDTFVRFYRVPIKP